MTPEKQAAELDLVIVGPVTRDLLPSGRWRLGGTALYATLAATRLGLRVGVVTRGPADVVAALREAIPSAQVMARLCAQATTFENVYDHSGARRQFLRGRCDVLRSEDIVRVWRRVGHVLLAPLARDVDPAIVEAFAAETRLAATPQGWLRQWDASGHVSAGRWAEAAMVLPRIETLILSDEDLGGTEAAQRVRPLEAAEDADWPGRDPQVLAWRDAGTLVVVTQGNRGAMLISRAGQERFPAFPVRGEDPTGAGDVFAAALLRAWWWGSNVRTAMRFANAAASFVVERDGTDGLPTHEEVQARLAISAAGAP